MALIDNLIIILYSVVGLSTFLFGFSLVFKNLRKINRIEREKFDLGDWLASIGFGVMFTLAILFALNLSIESFIITEDPLPSIAGFLLVIMIGILLIYPLWEVIFLGRPTADSVHDFHKFLESRILDRFKGKMAYLVSFGIFIVIYIIPVIVFTLLLDYSFIEILFVWFLLFPLFFLNYFAANGIVSAILQTSFRKTISSDIIEASNTGKNTKKMIINVFVMMITWLPFLLNAYNIANPIIRAINGYELLEKDPIMGIISLVTTVPLGIKGFFNKFWNKKSKTKTIDFLFSGYIFIAIGINMLINFFQINEGLVVSVFSQVGFLSSLSAIFSDYTLLVPIIVIQSLITLVYGLIIFFQKNSDFHSDIRLRATSIAFGIKDLDDLIKKDDPGAKKKRKEKERKYDYLTLYKSLLLPPVFSKYGVDLNEQVRLKARQYLLLISINSTEHAQKIVDFVFETSIDPKSSVKFKYSKYSVKEAINLLGDIGKKYPEFVMTRMIEALPESDIQIQRYILDALGDIGEKKENLIVILDEIEPLLESTRYELRTAAFQAISEMVMEGSNDDKEFIQIALKKVYEILSECYKNPDIIDTAMESLVQMSARIANDLDISKIIPFIHYSEGKDKDTNDYIIQNAIIVLGYMVYYNIDTFPLEDIKNYLKDKRNFIRYVACDAIGNFILKCPDNFKESLLVNLMIISLYDDDDDVCEMCTESITEFLVLNKNYEPIIDGQKISVLNYYLKALSSSERKIAEKASEALKSISPLYEENIYPQLEEIIKKQENLELVRDSLHVIALSGIEEHLSVDLNLIYGLTEHTDASVRSEAVYTLGLLSKNRTDIDENYIIKLIDDPDPQVRSQTIFALGKIGINKPDKVIPILIQGFFEIDRQSDDKINEVELFAESLGLIGAEHPSNEIIVSLQSGLMGDSNPFTKDVMAHALGAIGHGMIRSGNATRRIENEAFYNSVSWLRSQSKKEYTIGNLVIIFIEALQLKSIPNSVMDEISDSVQDLLPVFLFVDEDERKKNRILTTIKELLAQAYYSNYNNEILENIDRIDSLISFKRSFETDLTSLQEQFIFFSKQYTSDGKQFYDQGNVFLQLVKKEEPEFYDYALRSFEVAIDLAPFEFFTPNCLLQMAIILEHKGEHLEAKKKYEEALEIFSSLDEIEKMKECEQALTSIQQHL
ncbi:HEAT repeat domain-containing protein [Promethearchaeum syntrophicum]|uniref:HEAT repeat domain-containing protein n=1 Tax=Promethearchaeum syntrophicum TaxID=2594042 RepID=A0A5B9D6T9_9ARCH|nr:HEAT repeat domain-containing protein [Candidatus Prometheoarchaeum syntrophicum]QEE14681.1 HEAT repeat protein [Candidatus Prometheoarchaeum syntrophicum]